MNRIELQICPENEGIRIDKWLCSQNIDLTRSALQKLIENGNVFVNNSPVNKNYKLKNSDLVIINIPEPANHCPHKQYQVEYSAVLPLMFQVQEY